MAVRAARRRAVAAAAPLKVKIVVVVVPAAAAAAMAAAASCAKPFGGRLDTLGGAQATKASLRAPHECAEDAE